MAAKILLKTKPLPKPPHATPTAARPEWLAMPTTTHWRKKWRKRRPWQPACLLIQPRLPDGKSDPGLILAMSSKAQAAAAQFIEFGIEQGSQQDAALAMSRDDLYGPGLPVRRQGGAGLARLGRDFHSDPVVRWVVVQFFPLGVALGRNQPMALHACSEQTVVPRALDPVAGGPG